MPPTIEGFIVIFVIIVFIMIVYFFSKYGDRWKK